MREKSARRTGFRFILVSAVIIQAGCGQDRPSVENGGNDTAANDPALLHLPDSAGTGTAKTEADIWLADRYGPESGIIDYEVRSGEQRTTQTWYFRKHGAEEARYWRLDDGADPPTHITVIDGGYVSVRGPGDAAPVRSPWRADPNTAMPNFRNLTPEMRRLFELQELSERTVLDRTCAGYRLKIGGTVSDVWVWEGIMLYGEIQGAPDKRIEPVIMRAVSLQTDVPVPAEKFALEGEE